MGARSLLFQILISQISNVSKTNAFTSVTSNVKFRQIQSLKQQRSINNARRRQHQHVITRLFTSSGATSQHETDVKYMQLALSHARLGHGRTYPNPAVGCVLVNSRNEIIGEGFHPRAGMPHAEVFALFEAANHVTSGVTAAKSVMLSSSISQHGEDNVANVVDSLLTTYISEGGSKKLFHDCCPGVTAYVTLEPCCHYGKTPPCAAAFVDAGVTRVVVGYRDPNPKVDGGGVKLLEDNNIRVDFIGGDDEKDCGAAVENFVLRISSDVIDYESLMNGKKRVALRKICGGKKSGGDMPTVVLRSVEAGLPDARFFEEVDAKLWREEMVLLRLKDAVPKKKDAKMLGETVAGELNAHVAQVVGRTVLLYRPGNPPRLDLNALTAVGHDL
mmetsp:Transcript_1535/g.1960  ORF Transcript_1535/g.1960 Transcript_1535/m.1960 type:complete len:388 (-) Transcript_1535:96-1259(-)|eukprot:CAMPEP_0172513066 /NCGR_PEP_ID=MMETSP1066-20121228/249423_1 /TAXON_ID=671091 /ORGANISM="Coscinodiscus wailesii, Strain CCMP2513" /LENGTH=387 /DNA_ID=CAMNT_0013293153 /DNA_START=39 /DNA_END=1202 /DNA_ORIENTATION=+